MSDVVFEVRFKENGYSKVYVEGHDVVIDNGYNRFRRRVNKDNISRDDVLIAIGEFCGLMRDEVLDIVEV